MFVSMSKVSAPYNVEPANISINPTNATTYHYRMQWVLKAAAGVRVSLQLMFVLLRQSATRDCDGVLPLQKRVPA